MSYATLFMMGAALALLRGAHVRTDMLWEKFSDRTKGMIDSLAALLLFLPTMAILFFLSIDDFIHAVQIDELSKTVFPQPTPPASPSPSISPSS